MVDEESQDVVPEPAGGAPVNRDKRVDPVVLEGEIAGSGGDRYAPPPDAADAETQARSPFVAPPASHPSRANAFAAGALGGLIVSALVAGASYYFTASATDRTQEDANRLTGMEAQAQRESDALATLGKRIGALEGLSPAATLQSLDKRVSALETGNGASAAAGLDKRVGAVEEGNATATQTAQNLTKQLTDLRADVDAARGDIPRLAARVGKLEAGGPLTGGASSDLAAISTRIDKVEQALAAPKSESRVAAEKPSATDNAASIAIVAGALKDRLAAGEPFASELAELERLGVEPAALTALKAVVNGAPTARALTASFEAVAPKVRTAAANDAQGDMVDRFLGHMRGLVRVHKLDETAGDDPEALISQIEAALRRGDIGGALADFAKLPPAARKTAGDWQALAGERQAADAALQSIREAAVGRLAGETKP
jgi:hypothetical protein